jgi:DNA-binding winged helix-turn-helix (wHTH) protein/TolB-like protein
MEALAVAETFLFEGFRLDRRGLFRRDERGVFVPVAIGSRAFEVLRVLIAARGDLVSKDEIMAAVWPGTVVEDNNLTVQISTLRRILDQGRAEGSCVQTVAGRGYRFAALVTRCVVGMDQRPRDLSRTGVEPSVALADARSPDPQPSSISSAERQLPVMIGDLIGARVREEGAASAPSKPSAIPARRKLRAWVRSPAALGLLALVCVTVVITAVIVHWGGPGAPSSDSGPAVVVMPFRNQGDGAAQAKLGEAIAERIAVELARLPATRIVGQNTAASYAGKPIDSRQLNRELRVGYAVDGSVAAADGGLRVEAALVDIAADAVRWSDHFDFADGPLPRLADEIVTLIIRPVVLVLEQEEGTRAAAKKLEEQTADDLVWRGLAAYDRPQSQRNRDAARELFEKAVLLDPRNVWALSRLAHVDVTDVMNDPGQGDNAKLAHAEQLLSAAASIGRNDQTRYARCLLLRLQGRFDEAISICGEVIGNLLYRAFVYKEIGLDHLFLGQLEQAAIAFETADRLSRSNVRNWPSLRGGGVSHLIQGRNWQWLRAGGFAYLLAGRHEEAIDWLRQASDTVPATAADGTRVLLAAAYALSGRQQEAVDTVAELRAGNSEILANPDKLSAAIYLRPGTALAPRLQPVIEALRSAGLSEPMVAALFDGANGSTGERRGISAPTDVTLGSSVKVRTGD